MLALAGQCMPTFWLCILLILIFAAQLRSLPVYGRDGPSAIVLPAVRVGERYLTAASTTLRIQLAHQTGALELLATTVYYDQLDDEAEYKGFLVGLRIVEMNETDRARYEAVISQNHPQ